MGRQENKNKRNKGNRTGLQGNLGRNEKWAEKNMRKMFFMNFFSAVLKLKPKLKFKSNKFSNSNKFKYFPKIEI
jgi:hypothetical protein